MFSIAISVRSASSKVIKYKPIAKSEMAKFMIKTIELGFAI